MKRRSDENGAVRDLISKGSCREQLQYEVKTLTKTERESLLDQAMLAGPSAQIPDEDVLALKSDLSIPWKKMRLLRRYVIGHSAKLIIHTQMDECLEGQSG